MEIKVKKHLLKPWEKIIEITSKKGLVATIIPRSHEIVLVSRFVSGVTKDMKHPPKITFHVDLDNA